MARPGRYKIVRKIADGGMAEIFLATQHGAEGFERPVVLKRILAALVADPQFRNMMVDEAHVAMGLNHSNIVQVLDLGRWNGRYFLVLELVDGWDLNLILHRLKTGGAEMPPQLALYITAEICRALAYAHGRTRAGKPLGIVHRDVSPHNVLISEQGEVKLTDFGIAKALGKREKTGQGIIKGKLAFMSPEQASGAPLDARSDLFSVGTILYLMATGRRPFEAPTDLEAILRVRQCDFPPPTDIKPDLNPKLAEVITKAMKLLPSERYQSAEEMLIDVEAVQRTVFAPAGQTELKRWLADLQKRDGVPPTTRAAAPAPADTSAVDLVEGQDVILEGDDIDDSLPLTGETLPALQAVKPLPPPIPADLQKEPPSAQHTVVDRRSNTGSASVRPAPDDDEPGDGRSGRRWLVGTMLFAVAGSVAAAVWMRTKGPAAQQAKRPAPAPPPPAPTSPVAEVPPPEPTAIAPAEPSRDPDSEEILPASDRPMGAPGVNPPDAGALPDGGPDADEEDEEELLKHAEPNAGDKVIGEESAPPPPPPPVAAEPAKKAAPQRPAPKPRPPETVSVRIVTRPEGAAVRIAGRVYGRTPLSLKFRAGITYELSFVKKGYVTASKKVTVSRRTSSVVVAMKKRPAPKRSFLQRLFGR